MKRIVKALTLGVMGSLLLPLSVSAQQQYAVCQKKASGTAQAFWSVDLVKVVPGTCLRVAPKMPNQAADKLYLQNAKNQIIEFNPKNFVLVDFDHFSDTPLSGIYADEKGETTISFAAADGQLVMKLTTAGKLTEIPMRPMLEKGGVVILSGKNPTFGNTTEMQWDNESGLLVMNKKTAYTRQKDNPTPPEYSIAQMLDLRVAKVMSKPHFHQNLADGQLPTCNFQSVAYLYRENAAKPLQVNLVPGDGAVNVEIRLAETQQLVTTQALPLDKINSGYINFNATRDTMLFQNRVFVAQTPPAESPQIDLKSLKK